MRRLLCRTALILLICQGQSVIAQERCLIHDEFCIHYSERQDIRCLECLMNAPYKDSIILAKESIIMKQELFIEDSESVIMDLDLQLTKMRNKRRNAYIIGGVSTLGVFLLTFFLVR